MQESRARSHFPARIPALKHWPIIEGWPAALKKRRGFGWSERFCKMAIDFLDIPIHPVTMQETLVWMEETIRKRRPRLICTMNAALLVWAQKDPFLKMVYQNADLVTADSTVVYYALKILGRGVPEPLEACQIMFEFIEKNYQKGYKFYFLGASQEISNRAIKNLKIKYPGIQIVGAHHGYFSKFDEIEIVKEIVESKPDCLFVGMSSPFKETFLTTYLDVMNVPVNLGVGGGIDIYAGKYRLAPSWLRKLGLAWFYRLILEPKRMLKRYLTTNSEFIWLFLKEWVRGGHPS